jgi:hypothetical protein
LFRVHGGETMTRRAARASSAMCHLWMRSGMTFRLQATLSLAAVPNVRYVVAGSIQSWKSTWKKAGISLISDHE